MNFFSVLLSQDIVLSLVFISLLSMSILSWYVIFYKGFRLKKEYQAYKFFLANNAQNQEWPISTANNNFEFNFSSHQKNVVFFLLQRTKQIRPILKKYQQQSPKDLLSMQLIQALDEIRFHLDHGLTILASIGSCAPFVGLFGTVLGIYHALGNIAKQSSAGINVVAGPISEALIATAFGLFVAIPAVLAYNAFVRLNRLLVQNLRHLAEQLNTYLSLNNYNNDE